jgi:lysophospholipase L1-like esterase
MVSKEENIAFSKKLLQKSNWISCAIILIFGFLTFDQESFIWGFIGIGVYLVPLLCQLSPYPIVKIFGIWFGFFLVLQSLITPLVHFNIEYRVLEKNIDVKVEREGEVHSITTDEMGFRVSPKIDYSKKKGLRIFALGGSTTEEIYTDDQQTWTHILQEKLEKHLKQPVEVINTGVSGARARNHFAKLQKIIEYKPDLVLFLIGVNDWNRQILDKVTIYPFESIYLRNSLLVKGIKGFKVFIWSRVKGKILIFFKMSHAKTKKNEPVKPENPGLYSKQTNSLNRPIKLSFQPRTVSLEFSKYLKKIILKCKNAKVPCLFLTQPHGYLKEASEGFKQKFWMTPPRKKYTLDFDSMIYIANLYNKYLLRFAKKKQMPSCDLAKVSEPLPDFFLDDCHFNKKGTQKVANFIFQCIKEKSIFSKKN